MPESKITFLPLPYEWARPGEQPPPIKRTGPKVYDWMAYAGLAASQPGRWLILDYSEGSENVARKAAVELKKRGLEAVTRSGELWVRVPVADEERGAA